MDAACVLEKIGGTKIIHIFVKIGGRKIKGEERLKHMFALSSSYFLKNSADAAPIIRSPNMQRDFINPTDVVIFYTRRPSRLRI